MDSTKGFKNYNPQLNSLRQVVMGCEDYTLHPHLLCLAFILEYAGRLSGFYGGLPTKNIASIPLKALLWVIIVREGSK